MMKEKVREMVDQVYVEASEATKTQKLIEYEIIRLGRSEALIKMRPRDIDLYSNFFQNQQQDQEISHDETAYNEAFNNFKADLDKFLGQMRRHKSVLVVEYQYFKSSLHPEIAKSRNL